MFGLPFRIFFGGLPDIEDLLIVVYPRRVLKGNSNEFHFDRSKGCTPILSKGTHKITDRAEMCQYNKRVGN